MQQVGCRLTVVLLQLTRGQGFSYFSIWWSTVSESIKYVNATGGTKLDGGAMKR